MEVCGGVRVFGAPTVVERGEWRNVACDTGKPKTTPVNGREKGECELRLPSHREERLGHIVSWIRIAEVLVVLYCMIGVGVVLWVVF
jgi:hypothetical protein